MVARRSLLQAALVLFVPGVRAGRSDAARVWRVGTLSGQAADSSFWAPFRKHLRELGYVENENLVIEWRSARGTARRLDTLAADLVRLKVDVIVASDNPAIDAARRATTAIPIVMVLALDPVAAGFVESLGRPGGNVTGLSTQSSDLPGKVLQLLKEAIPTVSRVAVLWDPTESGRRESALQAEAAGRTLKVQVTLLPTPHAAALDEAFAAAQREKVDAVLVQSSQMIASQRARIAELGLKHRIPTVSIARWYPEAGGLMSYGLSYDAQLRRAAFYVDRLLKGANAAELPVEQPTKFELVVNVKTAKALRLTIPPAVLLRADQVIE